MYFRIVTESFARTPRRKLLTGAALALGMAVATATLTVALDVGDRLSAEFRTLGANLLVSPQADTLPLKIGGVDYRPVEAGAYLEESDLPQLKKIFWGNNIIGFAPFLDVPVRLMNLGPAAATANPTPSQNSAPFGAAGLETTLEGTWISHVLKISAGESFRTGTSVTNPWWQLASGSWYHDEGLADAPQECVVGEALARQARVQLGDWIALQSAAKRLVKLRVSGIAVTGGPEDRAVLTSLRVAQDLAGKPGKIRRLMVSALTKPEDAFAERDWRTMSPAEKERWMCTAYVTSIAFEIEQAMPGVEARPVRQVAESEGHILGQISALLWVVTLAAVVAALLAMAATTATTLLERQREIGVMKALGAGNGLVAVLFLSEQILLALVGGGVGFAGGALLARWLSWSVFGAAAEARLILLPVTLGLALAVAIVASLAPLRRAARLDPAVVLRGE
jgi:putative ABC transport system permease protein